jgi:uncharacterized protein (DUF927 family)
MLPLLDGYVDNGPVNNGTPSERTPDERIENILNEAADLPDRQFFRKREEVRHRLYCETGQEWTTYDVVSEVRRRRQKRQGAPQLTRIDSAAVHDEYCKEGARLLPRHRQLIIDSAIKSEIARERGYRTVWTKSELSNYGFGPSQQITHTMLIPLYGPKGQLVGYQHRPDTPRLDKGDPPKPVKYETPFKWQMRIDVHPSLSRKIVTKNDGPYFDTTESPGPIGDPNIPLFITEGVRKADSAVSIALCCITLLGVWNWRGTNAAGGKTTLADWDDIPLNGRIVYMVFDSDVMTNPHVHAALVRLQAFLTQRGAAVRFIYLPSGPYGEKVGLDDFIAAQVNAGSSPEQIRTKLFEYATDKLRSLPNPQPARDDDNPVKWPFKLSDDGVWAAEETRDGEERQFFVCSRLDIVAVTRNQDGLEWGRVLTFKDDDGRTHEYPLAMELMAGDGTVYRERLLSMGLHIGPDQKARNRLHEYIQITTPKLRMTSVSRLGWHGRAFVMPDVVHGEAGAESVIYQQVRQSEHNFREAGSLTDWQEHIGKLCVNNTRLVFAVSCAFAAPLLYLTDTESGGFHFRGESSVGKTTAQWAAGSVWGGGGIRGYLKGWRTTINGLENVAVEQCDALLVLDEIGQAEPKAVAQAAYLLANGQGASRMRRDTSSRPVATWRTLYLSSGEISLAAKIEEDGRHKASAGQEIRILDIPAKVSDQLGLFEDLHGAPASRKFADDMKKAAAAYYGIPIRQFLSHLVTDIDEAKEAIGTAKADFLDKHLPKDASGQVARAADRFALVAAAGELAAAYGVLPWEPGEAIKGAAACFNAWLEQRPAGAGAAEIAAGIAQIQKFFEAHGESRFTEWSDGGVFSDDDDKPHPTINRAGFRRTTAHGRTEFFVFPQTFTTELCAGFDAKSIAQELIKRKLLLPGENNKTADRVTLPGIGRTRVYHFSSDILADPEDDQ